MHGKILNVVFKDRIGLVEQNKKHPKTFFLYRLPPGSILRKCFSMFFESAWEQLESPTQLAQEWSKNVFGVAIQNVKKHPKMFLDVSWWILKNKKHPKMFFDKPQSRYLANGKGYKLCATTRTEKRKSDHETYDRCDMFVFDARCSSVSSMQRLPESI